MRQSHRQPILSRMKQKTYTDDVATRYAYLVFLQVRSDLMREMVAKESQTIRLQKILSVAGIASRRAAEKLIGDGRVTVNGLTVRRLGVCADPQSDDIRVDGRRVARPGRRRYLLVHKPRGVVTTRRDPQRRRTVLDLVPRLNDYVYPVGRLDYDSEGLLLLTNDGEMASLLTHPSHGVARIYEATVRGCPTEQQLRRIAKGMRLDGRRTVPAEVRRISNARTSLRSDKACIEIVLREGRNRQVRRMFQSIGHPVVRLIRTSFGPLRLRGLKPGQARDLSAAELSVLRGVLNDGFRASNS